MAEYITATDGHEGHWLTGEEIVRCRDCDVSQKDGTRCLLFAGWEPIEDSDEYELVSAEVEPDGFCKWGKRRGGQVKRYYCDKCGKQIDIERDGFAQMSVQWWSRGDNSERMRYRPDFRHREGYEEYMMCAQCCNEVFGKLEGMDEA